MKTHKLASVSILSTAVLLSSIASPAVAATTFTDIPNNYAKDAIYKLADAGVFNGTGNGKFNPAGNITRQDFAIVISKALDLDTSIRPKTATFTDITPDSYAFAAVEAASKAGLIKGTGNGKFEGTQPLTREQMAVIFVSALNVDVTGKASGLQFSDSSAISAWAEDYVAAAIELKLMAGNQDGTFNPTANAIRQDVALVTSKFLTKKSEIDQEQSEEPSIDPEPEQEQEQEQVIEPEKPIQQPSTPVSEPTSPSIPSTPSEPEPEPEPIPEPTPEPLPEPTPNEAPIVKDLEFRFAEEDKGPVVGNTVYIDFTYEDKEQDPPQIMYYKWYRSIDANGSNKELIPNNNFNHYTPVPEDIGKYISVEVTPIAATGTTTGLASYQSLESAVIEDLVETPLSVDVSKFTVIDNYSGQYDRIIGQPSAVSRANAWVYIYPWNDSNGNNIVDDGELTLKYNMGLSQADGSLSSDLGLFEPGDYVYVITATDAVTGYESEKSADNAFRFTLTKGVNNPTIETELFLFGNGESQEVFIEGDIMDELDFYYITNDNFNNGTLEITIDGISFTQGDEYSITTSYSHIGDPEVIHQLTPEQISNDGRTITISGINGYYTALSFFLNNKVIPEPGQYKITVKADADGTESAKSPSQEQYITIVSEPNNTEPIQDTDQEPSFEY